MPFKSRKQERYLQINEPEIYRDWVEEYGHFKGAEAFSAEVPPICPDCHGKLNSYGEPSYPMMEEDTESSTGWRCWMCGGERLETPADRIRIQNMGSESFGSEFFIKNLPLHHPKVVANIRKGMVGDTAYQWYVDGDESIQDRNGEPLIRPYDEEEIDEDIRRNIKIVLERGENKGNGYHGVDDFHDRFDEPQSYGIFYSWGAESFSAEPVNQYDWFRIYTESDALGDEMSDWYYGTDFETASRDFDEYTQGWDKVQLVGYTIDEDGNEDQDEIRFFLSGNTYDAESFSAQEYGTNCNTCGGFLRECIGYVDGEPCNQAGSEPRLCTKCEDDIRCSSCSKLYFHYGGADPQEVCDVCHQIIGYDPISNLNYSHKGWCKWDAGMGQTALTCESCWEEPAGWSDELGYIFFEEGHPLSNSDYGTLCLECLKDEDESVYEQLINQPAKESKKEHKESKWWKFWKAESFNAEGDYEPSFDSLEERIEWMEFAVNDKFLHQYEDDYSNVVLDIEEWNENNGNNSKLSNLVKQYKNKTGWMDAESFAADGKTKRKKCKRPYCTKPIIVDFNGYCSQICESKEKPDWMAAESFSAEFAAEASYCSNFNDHQWIPFGSEEMSCDKCDAIVTPETIKLASEDMFAESFSAELKRDSCCCGATKSKPCACMIQGVMECNATCPCSLEKSAESFSAESGDKPSCGHAECMDFGMDGWLSDREIVFKYFTQWRNNDNPSFNATYFTDSPIQALNSLSPEDMNDIANEQRESVGCYRENWVAESFGAEVLSIVNPSGRSENDDPRKLYVSIGFRDGEIYRGYVELDSEYEMDEEGYQRKKAESFGAESCDDLCTQCESCDTCIDGVCENVEEEWGREWADFDHLCRRCHDKHIEELGMIAESFSAEMSHADKGMRIWEMVQQNLNNPLAVEGFYATFFGEDTEYYDGMDSAVIEAVKDLSKNPEWTDELFKEYGLDNCYWCGEDSKTTKYLPFDEGEYAYWCKECYEDSEGEKWDAESFGADSSETFVFNVADVSGESDDVFTYFIKADNEVEAEEKLHYEVSQDYPDMKFDFMLDGSFGAESFGADSVSEPIYLLQDLQIAGACLGTESFLRAEMLNTYFYSIYDGSDEDFPDDYNSKPIEEILEEIELSVGDKYPTNFRLEKFDFPEYGYWFEPKIENEGKRVFPKNGVIAFGEPYAKLDASRAAIGTQKIQMVKSWLKDDKEAESFNSYKVAPDLSSYTKAELVSSIAGPQGTAAYQEVVYDPIAQSRMSAETATQRFKDYGNSLAGDSVCPACGSEDWDESFEDEGRGYCGCGHEFSVDSAAANPLLTFYELEALKEQGTLTSDQKEYLEWTITSTLRDLDSSSYTKQHIQDELVAHGWTLNRWGNAEPPKESASTLVVNAEGIDSFSPARLMVLGASIGVALGLYKTRGD